MRKQIAAANWKMNLEFQQAEQLLDALAGAGISLKENDKVVVAVPFPYLYLAKQKLKNTEGFFVAAQNCYTQAAGAYTGEVSLPMLSSMNIDYVVIGHSERREIFGETSAMLAQKIDISLLHNVKPIFCCGEPLQIREQERQNDYVETQIKESLFHLTTDQLVDVVIAYEPIWAIGTGRTASAEQAQEMHAHIRRVIAGKYGGESADSVSILYGGSVKSSNAAEIFGKPDVDGGLVGGASLNASEFTEIIRGLK
ncbi:MAG: triose-phosphate isomerase [Ginsengibacter sp.]